MMIAHVSLPADDTAKVAETLARIMNGTAVPIPPGGPGAWMAWSGDELVEIEVIPRGAVMQPAEGGGNWQPQAEAASTSRRSECHFALCVDRPAKEVIDIAEAAGWPSTICDRGGFFHVVEVWIEDAFLMEVLDPEYTAAYKASMSLANWHSVFGTAQAALK
ncbi:hypothetical protein K1X12_00695 [Hyphomonas sp. WL0036]|uniref:hypothetical protein n=1 Tax=Hyphomonas sediminis TaxID=2866160 RepID=UPI001C7E47C5|nr:hypothetical protein [Hyphomonas sediminis]MBY9065393.1 hypothetical protein [Hyphomonas sediminis]